jgi:hypothetical protein
MWSIACATFNSSDVLRDSGAMSARISLGASCF